MVTGARRCAVTGTDEKTEDWGNLAELVRSSALVVVGQNRESVVIAADGRTPGVCLIETRCSGVSW